MGKFHLGKLKQKHFHTMTILLFSRHTLLIWLLEETFPFLFPFVESLLFVFNERQDSISRLILLN